MLALKRIDGLMKVMCSGWWKKRGENGETECNKDRREKTKDMREGKRQKWH